MMDRLRTQEEKDEAEVRTRDKIVRTQYIIVRERRT